MPSLDCKPHIVVVCGKSGSGKTPWLKQQIKNDRRVLVWDVKNEYANGRRPIPGFVAVYGPVQLLAAVKNSRAARLAFVPPAVTKDMFSYWARVALAWGNCTVIAEETSDVTYAGKAPPGWGEVIRRGKDQGLKVYAVTQRPSESEKTSVGNATLIHCGQLRRPSDRKYMAEEMGIDRAMLDNLRPLDWVEVDDFGRVRTGRLRF